MSETPRPYDESFIRAQLHQMLEKQWTYEQIAGWFARWGYEEGKMAVMLAQNEQLKDLQARYDHIVHEFTKYMANVPAPVMILQQPSTEPDDKTLSSEPETGEPDRT